MLVLKRTVIVNPEKDWLLEQELYSAILPGNCSLIIEVVPEVIPLSFGFSSRVSVWQIKGVLVSMSMNKRPEMHNNQMN